MSNHIPKEKVPDGYTCLGILKQNKEKKILFLFCSKDEIKLSKTPPPSQTKNQIK